MPSGASTLYHRRRLVSGSHMLVRRVHRLGATSCPPRASSTMMGHVPQRVGHDGCPVGSRATERQYRDRQASWRAVRRIWEGFRVGGETVAGVACGEWGGGEVACW